MAQKHKFAGNRLQQKIKRRLKRYKEMKGCEKCGYNDDGRAICWAHIDPMLKNAELGKWRAAGSNMAMHIQRVTSGKNKKLNIQRMREVFRELRKCKLLCTNCHTLETLDRGESKRGHETHKARMEMINPTSNLEQFFT